MKNNQPKHIKNFGKDYGDWTDKPIDEGSIGQQPHRGVINKYPEDTYVTPKPIKSTRKSTLYKEKNMWTKPIINEITVGLEINCYACAEL